MAEADATTPSATSPSAETGQPTGVADGTTGQGSPMLLDWRSGWPEDLQKEPMLQAFKEPVALAKSYIETKRMVGDRIKFVEGWDDGATSDEAKQFRTKAGVPDDAGGYQVELAKLPDGVEWDEELLGTVKALAHKHAMTPKQLKAMLDVHATWMTQTLNKAEAAKVEAERRSQAEMDKTWGGMKTYKLTRAQKTLARVTNSEQGQAVWDKIEASGLGNDLQFIEFFSNLYDYLPEDTFVDGATGTAPTLGALGEQITLQRQKVNELARFGGEAFNQAQQQLNRLYQQKEAMEQRQANRQYVRT